jgi:hypothetical protein
MTRPQVGIWTGLGILALVGGEWQRPELTIRLRETCR